MNIETIRSSFDLKIRSGMFRPVTRRLHADMAEDRVQDALALVYQQYRRHAEKGEILDDALLVHAARLRAEDLSRQVVRCGGKARKTCAMDPRNYFEGKVEMLRLDKILDDKEECRLLGLADFMVANPTRQIVSAIDLEAWIASLPEDDQVLLSMRMAGHRLKSIARRLGIRTEKAWSRCRRLGHELAERAQLEIPVSRQRVRN
jgi:DNA-directed RNA polymerase specialized sigma24 family protein